MTTPDLTNLIDAGRELAAARNRLLLAKRQARATAFEALNNGASEVKVAKTIGVDRNTIRRWQGK